MNISETVIIVGSGLGGLLCGNILSKEGYRVIVLEKHSQIGGNLQTFKRNGCVFDTGMHYIGCMDEEQILHKIFSYLDITDKLKLRKLNKNAFDIIGFPDKDYNYAMGFDNFENILTQYFFEEKRSIHEYVGRIKSVWDKLNIVNLRDVSGDAKFYESQNVNTYDFLDSLFSNKRLKAVLAGNNLLYGGIKEKSSLFVHALIMNYFIRSSYRIAGGSSVLAEIIKNNIEKNGGSVYTNQEVVKLISKDNRIKAAQVKNKHKHYGDIFISNIHPLLTNDITDQNIYRKARFNRIKRLKNTVSAFSVYIVLEKFKLRYFNSNYYYNKTDDVWQANNYATGDWPLCYLLYMTPDSDNPEYAESITIITTMRFEEVKKWENTNIGKRGNDYIEFKRKKANIIFDLVNNKYPGIRNFIKNYYTATPLTYRDYTGTVDGTMYGLVEDHKSPHGSYVSSKTRMPNLFLTGQNVNLHGMLGVTITSLTTCGNIIDINSIIRKIKVK